MKKTAVMLLLGAIIGFFAGRIIPPRHPSSWKDIQIGMHYSEVYKVVPDLAGGMRDVKGLDTCTAEFGNSYWQLFVYYDNKGNVKSFKTKLY